MGSPMAISRRFLNYHWLIPGLIAAMLILGIAGFSLLALIIYSPQYQSVAVATQEILNDSYLWHTIRFTFYQAFLSALLSVLPAIFIAGALFRRHFIGRALLLRLLSMTFVLPVLVVVFGLLAIYGSQGGVATLLRQFGLSYNFSIYGLHGILIAHVFFNLPLATRLFLQVYEGIPTEQRQLSCQLGMNTWQQFRLIEWPALLRQVFPVAALIFMICFASFATVLALGGGPKATTIEVAIYQALRYDFDLSRAALLALVQLLSCLVIMVVSQKLSTSLPVGESREFSWRAHLTSRKLLCYDSLLISLLILLVFPPLLAVVYEGVNAALFDVLAQPRLWQALLISLHIALGAAIVSVTLTMMLLWSSRILYFYGEKQKARWLELSGMTVLAMPTIVLATGFFLLFIHYGGLPESPIYLIIFVNGLIAIPYTLKVLTVPMYTLTERYHFISLSLGIKGVTHLRLIELKALKQPLVQAFALASLLSIGDFGIIALFGSEQFTTLPYYLYEQLGAYRSQQGAVTALILLLFCLSISTFIERLTLHDHAK